MHRKTAVFNRSSTIFIAVACARAYCHPNSQDIKRTQRPIRATYRRIKLPIPWKEDIWSKKGLPRKCEWRCFEQVLVTTQPSCCWRALFLILFL
ncbi:hypothetical protein CDAR_125331 [Caerostris darwini]|uniref:Secreted protein n=1 Tax=Caerostris darwini TaxID=1538125 RepID=A0AAV4Q1N6_9ARAC|nr:hypothetical protein CDAR_125331 [Caerostris darwini]